MRVNLCIFLLLFSPTLTFAQGSDTGLDDMSLEDLMNVRVTTATKTEMNIEDAPGSLTVITRQQIQDMNARTLRDVLNVFVPGMDVVPAYFRYGDRVNEGIYSRGLLSDFAQQVLILFNGQSKFNETTWGSPFPAIEFSLHNIERVEISRSPIPIYGGSAITTINLITREQYLKDKTNVETYASTSRHDKLSKGPQAKGIAIANGKEIGAWIFSQSAEFYNDQGHPHTDANGRGGYALPPDTLRDGTQQAVGATLVAQSTDGKYSFQTWYKNIRKDAFLSAQLASQSTELYRYEGTVWLNNFKFKPSKSLEFILGAQTSKWTNYYDFAGTPSGGDESNFDVYLEANKTFEFESYEKLSLLTGVKYEREGQYDATGYVWNGQGFDANKSSAASFAPNDSRDVFSGYSEANWKLSTGTSLLTGLRVDHYEGFANLSETLINPRLAVSSKLGGGFLLKGLYASAGRPPSIYERSGVNVVPLAGSSNIKSEKVHTLEASLIYNRSGLKIQATPFYQVFQNKIEYLPDGTGTVFTATNNGETQVAGMDFDLWYYFKPRIYFFMNASTFKSEDREGKHDTYFLASQYLNGGFNYGHDKWNHNINAYWRGPRELPATLTVNKEHASSAHLQLNFSNSYQFNNALRLAFLIENLTDERNNVPLSVDGFFVPERGRTFTLQLTADL